MIIDAVKEDYASVCERCQVNIISKSSKGIFKDEYLIIDKTQRFALQYCNEIMYSLGSKKVKGIFITELGRIEMLEVPKPTPGPYDALVEIKACGICNSTDWKLIQGEFFSGTYPVLLGHESVGKVVAVGDKVRNYHIGDMVLRPGLQDDQIPFEGGRSCWGGFAEFAIVTDFWAENGIEYGTSQHPQQIVPSGIPAHEAVALITLKENLSCLNNTGVGKNHSLAIVGTGPVAQAQTICAKLSGISPVVVFGRQAKWETLFMDLGADAYVTEKHIPLSIQKILDAGGFDRVIEAVGSRDALSKCLKLCAPSGKINLYGISPESEPYLEKEETDFRVFRSDVIEADAHTRMLEWVAGGEIQLSDWVSHVLPWAEYQKGFDMVQKKEAVKMVLTF